MKRDEDNMAGRKPAAKLPKPFPLMRRRPRGGNIEAQHVLIFLLALVLLAILGGTASLLWRQWRAMPPTIAEAAQPVPQSVSAPAPVAAAKAAPNPAPKTAATPPQPVLPPVANDAIDRALVESTVPPANIKSLSSETRSDAWGKWQYRGYDVTLPPDLNWPKLRSRLVANLAGSRLSVIEQRGTEPGAARIRVTQQSRIIAEAVIHPMEAAPERAVPVLKGSEPVKDTDEIIADLNRRIKIKTDRKIEIETVRINREMGVPSETLPEPAPTPVVPSAPEPMPQPPTQLVSQPTPVPDPALAEIVPLPPPAVTLAPEANQEIGVPKVVEPEHVPVSVAPSVPAPLPDDAPQVAVAPAPEANREIGVPRVVEAGPVQVFEASPVPERVPEPKPETQPEPIAQPEPEPASLPLPASIPEPTPLPKPAPQVNISAPLPALEPASSFPDSRVSPDSQSSPSEPIIQPKPEPTKKLLIASARDGRPRLAVILDDGGYGGPDTEQVLALDPKVTLAILPNTPAARTTAQRAEEKGFEVMLHMPMETAVKGIHAVGGQLDTGMDRDMIRRLTLDALAQVPGAKGVNYHTGGKFIQDYDRTQWFMEVVRDQKLYFIDSRTTGHSAGHAAAAALGVRTADRDVFLDNESAPDYIRGQFEMLVDGAQKRGAAVGIGHFRHNTVSVLREVLPGLSARGIELVHVSELLP